MESDEQQHVIRRLETLLREARTTMEQTKRLIKVTQGWLDGQERQPNEPKPPDDSGSDSP
jgi:hypothetical protein